MPRYLSVGRATGRTGGGRRQIAWLLHICCLDRPYAACVPGSSNAAIILYALLAGSAAGVLLGVVAGSVTGNMGAWLMLGTSMGASVGFTAGFIWWAVTRPSTRGRCPACGYDMHGLPCDAGTGEATCPECGGAVAELTSSETGDDGDRSGLP